MIVFNLETVMATKHTSSSKTAGSSAVFVTSANGARRLLSVQPLDGDIYVRTDGQAATVGGGSILVTEGKELFYDGDSCPSDAISAIRAGSSDVAVTVVEG